MQSLLASGLHSSECQQQPCEQDNYVEGTLDTTYISTFGKGTRTLVSNTNVSMATEEGEGQGIATVL